MKKTFLASFVFVSLSCFAQKKDTVSKSQPTTKSDSTQKKNQQVPLIVFQGDDIILLWNALQKSREDHTIIMRLQQIIEMQMKKKDK